MIVSGMFEPFKGLPWKWDANDEHEVAVEEQMIPIEADSGEPIAEHDNQDDDDDVQRRTVFKFMLTI